MWWNFEEKLTTSKFTAWFLCRFLCKYYSRIWYIQNYFIHFHNGFDMRVLQVNVCKYYFIQLWKYTMWSHQRLKSMGNKLISKMPTPPPSKGRPPPSKGRPPWTEWQTPVKTLPSPILYILKKEVISSLVRDMPTSANISIWRRHFCLLNLLRSQQLQWHYGLSGLYLAWNDLHFQSRNNGF